MNYVGFSEDAKGNVHLIGIGSKELLQSQVPEGCNLILRPRMPWEGHEVSQARVLPNP